MLARTIQTVVVALTLLWFMVHPAVGAILQNTIEPAATLSAEGRHLSVTVRLICPQAEKLRVGVTVTQDETGAVGEGRTQGSCTGALQYLTVKVISRGATPFAVGEAEACALGVTRSRGTVTNTRQWCSAEGITLAQAE